MKNPFRLAHLFADKPLIGPNPIPYYGRATTEALVSCLLAGNSIRLTFSMRLLG